MSEIKAVAYQITTSDGGKFLVFNKLSEEPYNMDGIDPLYTKQQLDKAIEERDILIRDLRKELNERRYGRSAS